MNRIDKCFADLKKENKKALITFITAGDPDLATTLDIMKALADNGVDIIELGVPFSDPIADGPIIQASTVRALKNKITIHDILKLVTDFRKTHQTPVVLMGYLNPILRFGPKDFFTEMKQAGGDGVIIADLPYEEGEEYEELRKEFDISLIYLLAPETGTDRTKNILKASSGFVYCVAHYGTTGTDEQFDHEAVKSVITSFKKMTQLPLAIGFGVSSVEQAKLFSQFADGVIIGSWLINELQKSDDKAQTAAQFALAVKNSITR